MIDLLEIIGWDFLPLFWFLPNVIWHSCVYHISVPCEKPILTRTGNIIFQIQVFPEILTKAFETEKHANFCHTLSHFIFISISILLPFIFLLLAAGWTHSITSCLTSSKFGCTRICPANFRWKVQKLDHASFFVNMFYAQNNYVMKWK